MFQVNFYMIHFRSLFLIYQLFTICSYGQSAVSRIDSLMNSYYSSRLPGAVIAIEQNHKLIFKKGYGLANLLSGQTISADGNFNIGSLTKQFTAFAVLKLYYAGKFSLTDSIGKFFTLKSPLSSISIRQLLSHSSGIPDHYGYTDTFLVKHARDRDVLVAIQKADSLYFPSGSRYRYSNTAYCLLGLLIEKISGLSYNDFLQDNIFKPLGIHQAQVYDSQRIISNRVTGFERTKNGSFVKSDAEESIFFSTEADGGIYISMNNYLKWCRAVESGIFSNSPMIEYCWQAHTPVDSARGLWYGAGWFIQENRNQPAAKMIYHTGFNGGFRTVVFMIASMNYCISIFSNRGDIDLEELVTRINRILQVPDNSFIKSGPLESFNNSWPKFAPCKETSSFSTSFIRNSNAKGMVLN
jgi:D-alanyl-D-alanine carboxypeptidase